MLANEDAELLVMGNTNSKMFPQELIPYTTRRTFGNGGIKVNFLVNYCPNWDLSSPTPHSQDISRVDLIIRWGGMCRLSGFLPMQSVYSDFYVIPELWPEFKPEHINQAINWYNQQDITLGG